MSFSLDPPQHIESGWARTGCESPALSTQVLNLHHSSPIGLQEEAGWEGQPFMDV